MRAQFPLHQTFRKNEKKVFKSEKGKVFFEESYWHLVMAGEPVVSPRFEMAELLKDFLSFAKRRRKRVCGYYCSEAFNEMDLFQKRQIGTSTVLCLSNFNLKGREKRDLRRALNQGERDQLTFEEIKTGTRKVDSKLDQLYQKWICTRRGPRIGFLLSPPCIEKSDRCFAVWEKNELIAFVSLFAYEQEGKCSYYVDDMIHDPQGHRFALNYLLAEICLLLKKERVGHLSLGLNVFDGMNRSGVLGWGLSFFDFFQWPYKSKGLFLFKRKFSHRTVPRYLIKERMDWWGFVLLSLAIVTYFQPRRRSVSHCKYLSHTKEKLMNS